MEAIIIKEGVVTNRIIIASLAQGSVIFPNSIVIQDDNRQYSIGDNYAE